MPKKIARTTVNVLTFIYILFILPFALTGIFGIRTYAVTSGSMEPDIPTASLVFVKNTSFENLKKYLLPISTLATPNVPEAEILSGINIKNFQDMQNAAKIISDKYGCAVLCKGGHLEDCSDDLLYSDGEFYTYPSVRIDNPNTHGTGCTLSSAIASNLAKGFEIPQAVENAKAYVTKAIGVKLDLGKGRGPLMHNYILQNFK